MSRTPSSTRSGGIPYGCSPRNGIRWVSLLAACPESVVAVTDPPSFPAVRIGRHGRGGDTPRSGRRGREARADGGDGGDRGAGRAGQPQRRGREQQARAPRGPQVPVQLGEPPQL